MMPDYESWRSANQPQGFSLFDYVHAIMSTNDLPTDLLLAMARLLWPEFVALRQHARERESLRRQGWPRPCGPLRQRQNHRTRRPPVFYEIQASQKRPRGIQGGIQASR